MTHGPEDPVGKAFEKADGLWGWRPCPGWLSDGPTGLLAKHITHVPAQSPEGGEGHLYGEEGPWTLTVVLKPKQR